VVIQASCPAQTSVSADRFVARNPLLLLHSSVTAKCKKNDTSDNLLHKDRKEKRNNEQPTHKTAHLQTIQADTRPKFAKELFSCLHTSGYWYICVD